MVLTARKDHETGREYALRMLKDNIIRLELEPGSMVSEKELAEQMGLSRGPVWEALMELARVKIVEVYPQRGNTIALVDYSLIDQACFMRETLECAVVERCCTLDTVPGTFDSLRENLRLQDLYLENRDHEKLLELDNGFHRLLFSIAGLLMVHALMDSLMVHFDRVRAMALVAVKRNRNVEDHHAIFEAILHRDARGAKALMHTHLTRYRVDRAEVFKHYPQYMK